jgi:hypothetical protein
VEWAAITELPGLADATPKLEEAVTAVTLTGGENGLNAVSDAEPARSGSALGAQDYRAPAPILCYASYHFKPCKKAGATSY